MRTKTVIVGGRGHVGLSLGLVMAVFSGRFVTLLDVDASKVATVNRGEMPFRENGAEELLPAVLVTH